MKRAILVVALCGFLAGPAFADLTVKMWYGSDLNAFRQGSGGEFTAQLIEGWSSNALLAYSADTKNQVSTYNQSFQTFCVETTEYIENGHLYHVVLNDYAEFGGAGGGRPDYISQGTAYLYYRFATGTLTGYQYSEATGLRDDSAAALQKMIWLLEDEATYPVAFAGVLDAKFGTNYVGGTAAQQAAALATWKANNDFNMIPVKAMNLTGSPASQDQLYLVPIPAAFLLGMLGLGVAGLKLRKFA